MWLLLAVSRGITVSSIVNGGSMCIFLRGRPEPMVLEEFDNHRSCPFQ